MVWAQLLTFCRKKHFWSAESPQGAKWHPRMVRKPMVLLLFAPPGFWAVGSSACTFVLGSSMPLKDFSTPPKPMVFHRFSMILY